MRPDPFEHTMASNTIAEDIDRGNLRAARRGMLVTPRFGLRNRVETAHLALEVAANMIAVHMTNQESGAEAIALIRKVQAVFGPEEPEHENP